MNGAIMVLGIVPVLLGIFLLIIGSRSRGEMDMELGFFKGPIWFLVMVLGIFIVLVGIVAP